MDKFAFNSNRGKEWEKSFDDFMETYREGVSESEDMGPADARFLISSVLSAFFTSMQYTDRRIAQYHQWLLDNYDLTPKTLLP